MAALPGRRRALRLRRLRRAGRVRLRRDLRPRRGIRAPRTIGCGGLGRTRYRAPLRRPRPARKNAPATATAAAMRRARSRFLPRRRHPSTRLPQLRGYRWDRLRRFVARLSAQPFDECLCFRPTRGLRGAHDEIRAAGRVLATKRRHQLALCDELIDQRTAAERDALPVDRRAHQQVVLVEADQARGSWLRYADRREPLRPIEPWISAAIVVEIEEHVPSQILGLLQRTRWIGCQRRAANRLQTFAEQAQSVARRHRLRAIAHREVDTLPVEIEDAVVGGDEYVDLRMPLAETRKARQQPQWGKRDRGRDRQRLHGLLAANHGHREAKLVENRPRRDLQNLPCLGQSKRAMPALEKGDAELFLKRLHLTR